MSDWKLFILKVKKPNEKIQKEKPKTKQNNIWGNTLSPKLPEKKKRDSFAKFQFSQTKF